MKRPACPRGWPRVRAPARRSAPPAARPARTRPRRRSPGPCDSRWGRYLACDSADPPPCGPLAALFAAAARHPRLRGLLPYTSLFSLRFSRTTGGPFTRDCPYAEPIGDGRYCVLGPDGSLGEGDAEQAAALLDAALPAGCGPAIEGTADDLEPQPPHG